MSDVLMGLFLLVCYTSLLAVVIGAIWKADRICTQRHAHAVATVESFESGVVTEISGDVAIVENARGEQLNVRIRHGRPQVGDRAGCRAGDRWRLEPERSAPAGTISLS